MTHGSLNERITRALAFMLRHQPEEFDLELDRFGWGELEDVIFALQERIGVDVDEEDVEEAIGASDRVRYEIKEEKIRALYGHSFAIDPGEPTEPPDELYIGVGSRDADRAEESGLRSGRRAFLHLARTEEEAQEAGRRAAKDYAVVTVFAGEAYDEGIDFYDRGSLFLADEIPGEFIEVGDTQHDGYEREHHRRSRGRRTDGPRGRGRGRGRGGRDRDGDGSRGRGRGRDDEGRGRGRDRDDERPRRDEGPKDEPRRAPRTEDAPRQETAPRPERSVEVRAPEPKREPKPEPKPERKPKPKPKPADAPSPGGFGAGID